MLRLVAAGALAGATAFIVMAVTVTARSRNMTRVEYAQAQIAEHGRQAARQSPKQRLINWLSRNGYTGDLPTFGVLAALIWGMTALALLFFGVPEIIAALASVALAAVVITIALGRIAAARRRRFDEQLLQALDMIAGQIAAGMGPQRAIEHVTTSSSDPFKTEMRRALDSATISRDLPQAMRDVATRYPSRAFDLFIAALEIDRDMGGRIEPALRQASSILKRDFELQAEADAELSQSKMEFYGLIGIIAFATTILLNSAADPLSSPVGIIAMLIAGANVAVGIFRGNRLLTKAGRDL